MSKAKFNFIQQQGFEGETEESAVVHFNALLFQPIMVGSFMLIGILTQSATLFFIFGLILWINTVLPSLNIFEIFYNATFRLMRNEPRLEPAPMPRRFMQGMAGTLMLGAAFTLVLGLNGVSLVFQGFIAVAFVALLFGKFCVGAFIYHYITGNATFANATCPWSR
jgi:hypothetical protein